jgi:pilus assembly protein Flp/PilA
VNSLLARLVANESAVTAIEYALLGGLVSIVIVGAVTTIGTSLNVLFFTAVAGALGSVP